MPFEPVVCVMLWKGFAHDKKGNLVDEFLSDRSQEATDGLLQTAASLRAAELEAAYAASCSSEPGHQLREEPYRLRAIGHSLGGASLLIYVTHCRRLGRPHHIHRLILLTPAGFLIKWPLVRPCAAACRCPLMSSSQEQKRKAAPLHQPRLGIELPIRCWCHSDGLHRKCSNAGSVG